MGPNTIRFLTTAWDNDDILAPRRAIYYGRPFKAHRGVQARDTLSPVIFNICVDAVVRQWRAAYPPRELDKLIFFYVDNGMFTGTKVGKTQQVLNL